MFTRNRSAASRGDCGGRYRFQSVKTMAHATRNAKRPQETRTRSHNEHDLQNLYIKMTVFCGRCPGTACFQSKCWWYGFSIARTRKTTRAQILPMGFDCVQTHAQRKSTSFFQSIRIDVGKTNIVVVVYAQCDQLLVPSGPQSVSLTAIIIFFFAAWILINVIIIIASMRMNFSFDWKKNVNLN